MGGKCHKIIQDAITAYWRITIFLKKIFGCPGKITFLY